MRQKGILVSLVLAMAALVSTLAAPPAAAAGNPNGTFFVVVSPISQNLEVTPGGSVTTTIQVRNQGIATEALKIKVMKFGARGQDGTPQLFSAAQNDQSVNWVSFSQTRFKAEPNVWTPVKVTFKPPQSAAFGYYYAIVFQRDVPASGGKQIAQVGAVASLVLLDVQAPGAVRKADVVEFSTPHTTTEFLPLTFKVRMHNTGNVHVAPRGNIFITKGGKNLALLEVNQAEGNVLPKSYRVYTATWDDGKPVYKEQTSSGKTLLDKKGQPVTKLDWSNFNLSKLRFGKYQAKLVMVYNNGQHDVSDTAYLSFWVIPWRILAVLLLILVVLAAGLWTLVVRPLRRSRGQGGRVSFR